MLSIQPVEGQTERTRELDAQYNRAETAFRTGSSLLEAKARIDRVVSAFPEDIEALKLRAQILLGMERADEALADARRATQLDAADGEAYLILCEAAHAARDTAAAQTAVEAAASHLPRVPEFHLRLTRCAVRNGELEQAEKIARAAIQLSPRDQVAHYQLASVLLLRDRRGEAIDVLVNGLRGGLLDARYIRQDSILARVIGSERLTGYLDR